MRAWLEQVVDRVFPGMGWRPLYLTATATWLMVLYYHLGGRGEAPRWFVDGAEQLLGLGIEAFHRHLWSHTVAAALLLLAPLLLCWLGERWTPVELGFGVRRAGRELLVVLGLWAVMVPLVWAVHDWPAFDRTYPRLAAAAGSARIFLLFEAFYLVKWVAWEFFFRGFLLFGLGRDLLHRAVLVSTIPFTLMHYGKPALEMASAMIAGLVLCFLALRSRSIWPGVLLHWLVAGTMNFFASTWWR